MHLSPKDLSFVGYTFKNFDAVKELRNSSGQGLHYTAPALILNMHIWWGIWYTVIKYSTIYYMSWAFASQFLSMKDCKPSELNIELLDSYFDGILEASSFPVYLKT